MNRKKSYKSQYKFEKVTHKNLHKKHTQAQVHKNMHNHTHIHAHSHTHTHTHTHTQRKDKMSQSILRIRFLWWFLSEISLKFDQVLM